MSAAYLETVHRVIVHREAQDDELWVTLAGTNAVGETSVVCVEARAFLSATGALNDALLNAFEHGLGLFHVEVTV